MIPLTFAHQPCQSHDCDPCWDLRIDAEMAAACRAEMDARRSA